MRSHWCWSRCRFWRWRILWLATVRSRASRGTWLLAFLAFLCNYDPNDDDDHEQAEQQQHSDDCDDDPNRKAGLLTSLGLRLLATLNQPIDFRVLREESFYF